MSKKPTYTMSEQELEWAEAEREHCPLYATGGHGPWMTKNARLREQAEALAAALECVRDIVIDAGERLLAATKGVDSILQVMTEGDVHQIWKAADATLHAYRAAAVRHESEVTG